MRLYFALFCLAVLSSCSGTRAKNPTLDPTVQFKLGGALNASVSNLSLCASSLELVPNTGVPVTVDLSTPISASYTSGSLPLTSAAVKSQTYAQIIMTVGPSCGTQSFGVTNLHGSFFDSSTTTVHFSGPFTIDSSTHSVLLVVSNLSTDLASITNSSQLLTSLSIVSGSIQVNAPEDPAATPILSWAGPSSGSQDLSLASTLALSTPGTYSITVSSSFYVRVRGVAGGGGGGGCDTAASQPGGAAGGGSANTSGTLINLAPGTTYQAIVGAAGVAGSDGPGPRNPCVGCNQPGTPGGNSTFRADLGTIYLNLEGGRNGKTYGCGPSSPCDDPRRGGIVLFGTGFNGGDGGMNGVVGTASSAGGGGGGNSKAGGNGGTENGQAALGTSNKDGGRGGGIRVLGDSTNRGWGGGASGCGGTGPSAGGQGVITFELVQ